MGAIKQALAELTDHEQQALERLHAIANGRYPDSHTGGGWLQDLARRKARELERTAYARFLDARDCDRDYWENIHNPYPSDFGRRTL